MYCSLSRRQRRTMVLLPPKQLQSQRWTHPQPKAARPCSARTCPGALQMTSSAASSLTVGRSPTAVLVCCSYHISSSPATPCVTCTSSVDSFVHNLSQGCCSSLHAGQALCYIPAITVRQEARARAESGLLGMLFCALFVLSVLCTLGYVKLGACMALMFISHLELCTWCHCLTCFLFLCSY